MKTPASPLLVLTLLVLCSGGAFAQEPKTPANAPATAVTPKPKPVPRLSAGLDDVVKLSQAGVEEGVILAFVQSSSIAYRPNAREIVQLRELGVTSAIMTAMLRRGEELRERAAAARREAAPALPATAPTAPAEPITPTPPAAPATSTVIINPAPAVSYAADYPAYRAPYNPVLIIHPSPTRFRDWCPPTYYSSRYSTPYYFSGYSRFGHHRGWSPRTTFSVGWGGYRGGFRHCR